MTGDKVLIALAEDNAGDVELVQEALQAAGLRYELTVCGDGEQMLELMKRVEEGDGSVPDLFLLDLNLPRVNGETILRKVRSTPATGLVPVIIITSSDSPRDREAAKTAGATAFFRKPSDLDQFLRLGDLARDLL